MMKVAVIGAGKWGRNLIRTFHTLGTLGAVVEIDKELRERVASEYPDLLLCENLHEVLATDLPAIAIATPAPTHAQIATEALLAGKDVFVEKPLALSSREANEVVRLAEHKQRILMVGHLLLYQPAIRWIKQYLQSGELGTLYSLHHERLSLGRVRSTENVLWSLGVHDLALALHLIESTPTRVQITGQAVLQKSLEDDVHLHLEFANGVHFHLHTSWLWPEKRRRLTLIGSQGMLVYDELQQTVMLYRKGFDHQLRQRDEGSQIVYQGSGEPLKLELEHFLACVQSRQRPLSDGTTGVAVARIIENALSRLDEEVKNERLLRP